MLDSNIILGTSANLEGCDQYAHGILTQEWEHWPCGVPIVFPDSGLKNSGGSVQVMTLITPSQNSAGRDSCTAPTSLVRPVSLKPLCGNHKVITVSEFDLGKFKRLNEFVKDVGGISMVIEYNKGRKDTPKALRRLEKKFEFSSSFYYNGWASKHLQGEKDRYVCVLTFLDLPYCVPIFNMRKVDGMGVSLSGATVEASKSYGQLHRIFRIDMMYSNYLDNIFVIDGIDVNRLNPIGSDMYRDLIQMAGQDLPVQKEKKKKSMADLERNQVRYGYVNKHGRPVEAYGGEKFDWKEAETKWKANQTVEVHMDEGQLVSNLSANIGFEAEPSEPTLEALEEEMLDEAPDDLPVPEAPTEVPQFSTDGSVQFYYNTTTSNSSNNDD